MNQLSWIIGTVVAIAVLTKLYPYYVTFQRLRQIHLQYPEYLPVEADALPTETIQLFDHCIAELNAFGFQVCTYLKTKAFAHLAIFDAWQVLLYHEETQTYAIASLSRPTTAFYPFNVDFYTWFQDQTVLTTINGEHHGLLTEQIPNAIVQDPYTAERQVQWEAHLATRQTLEGEKPVCHLSPLEFLQALETATHHYLDTLVATGVVQPIAGTALFRRTRKTAWQQTRRLYQGNPKMRPMLQQIAQRARTNPEALLAIPLEIEVENYYFRQQIEQSGKGSRSQGLGLLFLSFIGFVLSFSFHFHFQSLMILIGVVLFHELGHWGAMRYFGYQDTSIFFLPFLGGAAIGKKTNASLTEQFWVLLAGPLPGLVLGVGLLWLFNHSDGEQFWALGRSLTWKQELVGTLLLLNGFNLLPIYPLDGGKIVHLVMFSRFAYAEVVFKLCAIGLLLALSTQFPILAMLAVFVALPMVLEFRIAKLDAKLRRSQSTPPHDKDHLVKRILQLLQESEFKQLAFNTRNYITQELVERHQSTAAKWPTRFALLAVYLVCLGSSVGVPVGISGISLGSYRESIRAKRLAGLVEEVRAERHTQISQQIERALQTIQQSPQAAQGYLQRAQAQQALWYAELMSGTAPEQADLLRAAVADYDQVLRLQPRNATAYVERAELRRELKDTQGAFTDYSAAIRLGGDKGRLYGERAYVRQRLGDRPGAIGDFSAALKLEPKWVNGYVRRGWLQLELQQYQAAVQDAKRAIALDPQNQEAQRLQQMALAQFKQAPPAAIAPKPQKASAQAK